MSTVAGSYRNASAIETDPDELRDILWFRGRYGVTKDGRVFSHPKGGFLHGKKHPGVWLKPQRTAKGYLTVVLSDVWGHKKKITVHRCVAEAWIPNPDDLPQINHLNGLKQDNRAENLEWCTAAANNAHARARKWRRD